MVWGSESGQDELILRRGTRKMTTPSLLFGLVLSTLYGSIFHLWRGGGFGRLLLYIILGWFGFWAGHFLSDYYQWTFGLLGPLHVGAATIGSIIFLLIGYWLSLVEVDRSDR
jgi:uncharacterized membrane protein YeaQ/YmgE (transglycosylase-associated protein family)